MVADGRKIAQEILVQLKRKLKSISFQPKLIDVMVGDDPVIESYVNIKAKCAAEIGVDFEVKRLPVDISQRNLEDEVTRLNREKNLCGLIIQLPLPRRINKQKVLDRIDPRFDVDVITSANLGRLFAGAQWLAPATASAILKILDYYGIDLAGKNVLVIGAGDLVGKPVAFLLMQRLVTLTVANQSTKNLKDLCLRADIIIAGVGVSKLVKADMVKDGTVIIDAGTAESEWGICGDVDFESLAPKASLITPVPGGVGPVTVAMLLSNTVETALKLTGQDQ